MPTGSNSKKGMIEVEAQAAAPAGTVAKRTLRRTWAQPGDLVRVQAQPEVQEQLGDLGRVQAHAIAEALARAQTLVREWVRVLGAVDEPWTKGGVKELGYDGWRGFGENFRAEAEADAQVRMQALAWAEADAQVQGELEQVYSFARAKAKMNAQAQALPPRRAKPLKGRTLTMAMALGEVKEPRTVEEMHALDARWALDARTEQVQGEGLEQVYSFTRANAKANAQAQALPRLALGEVGAQGLNAWALDARTEADAQRRVSFAQAKMDAQVQAEVRARASTWAVELEKMHNAMKVWMHRQGQGQGQGQTWKRMSASKACKVDVAFGRWPQHRQDLRWLIPIITPINRLPPELLHQIFLILIDNDNVSPVVLMRVSRYWYNVVAGIWALLKLGMTTPTDAITRKLDRNQWLLDVVIDTEIDRRYVTWDAYGAIFAAMHATSRWRSLVVESFPTQADLPEDLVNRGLQQCPDPALSRLRTLIIRCPCEMSPLLDRLLRILGNTASRELTTVTINSPIVISFLVPTYSSIFRSVTVLSLDAPGLRNPVDLLPHLHQLEEFTASHLLLPDYQDDDDLPLVHTLRHLTLRSVSIQWMSGRTFHALKRCNLIFPLRRHVLHTLRITLPTCKHLSFKGNPLDILNGVSAHKLTRLSVMCSISWGQRGSLQLVRFASQALRASRLVPQILHIGIEATNQAWKLALTFMSNLEELVIYNARPSSLGAKSLQPLVILPVQANNTGTTATPGECNTPMCPSLRRFGIRYRRWLRSSEHFDLIPVFKSIIQSRQQSVLPLQSFRIWMGSDESGPLKLIEGSSESPEGFERLKKYAAITGRNL